MMKHVYTKVTRLVKLKKKYYVGLLNGSKGSLSSHEQS